MSRQDRIRAAHRNQFEQRQQVNRLYAQNLAQGMSPAQAATSPYTVKDTDTLASIAAASGVDPTNILDANPELKNIQTGMVINTPRPGSEQWRVQNAYGPGGVGLPSNAAFGSTTTNPQGINPSNVEKYRSSAAFRQEQGQPSYLDTLAANRQAQQQAVRNALSFLTPDTPYRGYGPNAPRAEQSRYPLYANNVAPPQSQYPGYSGDTQNISPRYPVYAGNQAPQQGPYPLYASGVIAMQQNQNRPAANTPTAQPPSPQNPVTDAPNRARSFAPRGNIVTFLDNITAQTGPTGRLPTEFELKYLINSGRVKPAQTATGGGGGYGWNRRRGRGGGGGGGKNRGGGTGQGERMPAFSSGSGSFGLINWRI
jgi:LysM repeat protein